MIKSLFTNSDYNKKKMDRHYPNYSHLAENALFSEENNKIAAKL